MDKDNVFSHLSCRSFLNLFTTFHPLTARQWCWFVEAVTKLYIASLSYRRIRVSGENLNSLHHCDSALFQNQIAVAMAAGDKVALKKLVVLRV